MPLDPQAAAFLKQAADAGAPPIGSLPVAETRAMLLSLFLPPGPREPIKKVENRVIEQGGVKIPIRIYTPEGKGTLPILIYYHGGGFVIGDCEAYDIPCRALANGAGCIVVSVDYRLAPEHKFPTPPEDCYAAAVWIAGHAAEVGGDAARVAVGGDSAGGNLSAVVAQMARDRKGPAIVFQLLIYPVTDHAANTPSSKANAEGYLLTKAAMDWFWGHYLSNPSDGAKPYASPLRATDFSKLPPALVVTAEFDPLRDEGIAYAQKLQQAGVKVKHSDYLGMIHGFFSLGHVLNRTKDVTKESCAELRAAFAR
ncbi:MAG: alpha/beta hydrolase [Candidatus Binataceae bacterium]